MPTNLHLHDVTQADLPVFFERRLDPVATTMAAFTAKDFADREAFMAQLTASSCAAPAVATSSSTAPSWSMWPAWI